MTAEQLCYESLRFRNQFILGPWPALEDLPGWQHVPIRGTWHIAAHPELRTVTGSRDGLEVVLLGTLLDPDSVGDSDEVILDRLLAPSGGASDIIRRSARLAGRWIIVVSDVTDSILFTDALGLRQVVYTSAGQPMPWVASQAGLLQRLATFHHDPINDAVLGTSSARAKREYWWPGDRTPLEGVRRLLPNHYLDLANHHVHRFWPSEEARVSTASSAAESCTALLRGVVDASARRFKTSVSVTAGLDSRIVLAASRNNATGLSFMTRQKHGEPADTADIRVASALLQSLNLRHDVVRPSAAAPIAEFRRAYFDNVLFAHEVWCPDAEAIWDRYRLSHVLLTGHGSEVGRCFYRLPPYARHPLNARKLAFLARMRPTTEILAALDQWLATIGDPRGYDLLDLFYWEQRMGQWLAMCHLECDSAWQDVIATFNCRELLETMLSVPAALRRPPHYHFFRTLLLELWPDALAHPLNPHKQKATSFHFRVRRAARRHWTLVRRLWLAQEPYR